MASKGASALTGAAGGAAAGSALGPWGAVGGAAIGGIAGYLSGDDNKAPTYNPDRRNFTYGIGPSDSYANQQSHAYDQHQAELEALQQDAYNRAAPTQAQPDAINFEQSGGQAYLHGADQPGRALQTSQLERLNNRVGALDAFANAPQGPSAAQAQLQAGADMAARQQYGMARTQPGGGGSALRSAAFNAAGITGNAANAAATLKANETADYQNRRLAALNSALGGAGTATGYAGQIRAGDTGFAATEAGQANYDAGSKNAFNQGQQQMQFQVGANNLNSDLNTRQQNDATTLGAIGASQNYDTLRNNVAAGQTASGVNYEAARAAGAGVGVNAASVNNAQSNTELAMGLGAASSGLGAYTASQGAAPKAPAPSGAPASYSWLNKGPGVDSNTNEFSDERVKKMERRESSLADALGTVGNAPGYSYKYKDTSMPGTRPGRVVGPMAQDIERGPLGNTIVNDTPQGKTVDTSRLSMVNTSAITELNRKVKALEAALGKAA